MFGANVTAIEGLPDLHSRVDAEAAINDTVRCMAMSSYSNFNFAYLGQYDQRHSPNSLASASTNRDL